MAQSGYTPILIYGSGTTGAQPDPANLTSSASGAELALNYFDGKLFYKDASNNVQVLAVKMPSGVLPIANGGTNASSFTAKSGNVAGLVFFDGTKLTNDATVTDVGYDTSTNTLKANNFALSGNVTSNLLFTDNTYDIGASGATRPRNLYLAGTATIGGSTTLSGGTANGVAYLNASKVLTTGSALTFDGTVFGVAGNTAAHTTYLTITNNNTSGYGPKLDFNIGFAGGYTSAELQAGATGTNGGYLNIYAKADGGALRQAQFIGDTYTGWFVGGSEQMRLTSTGLGIGLGGGSPAAKLSIQGSATLGSVYQAYITDNTGAFLRLGASSGGGEIQSTGGVALNLNYGGNNVVINGSSATGGNIGVGAAPNSWGASTGVTIQFKNGGSIFTNNSKTLYVGNNYYYDGTSNVLLADGYLTQYAQDTSTGAHAWISSSYTTAGSAVTSNAYVLQGKKDYSIALQGASSQSGIGITFPPTSIAHSSSNANTLDDYEEGTWTPTYIGGGGTTNPTVTYSIRNGTYVKIGRVVTASVRLNVATVSGGSGLLQISGLPFTIDSGNSNCWSGVVGWNSQGSFANGHNMLSIEGAGGYAYMYCHYITSNGATYDVNVQDLQVNTAIEASIVYMSA